MAEIAGDIYVDEVMTRSPVIGDPGMTARKAALIMRERGVGSLVIVENGEPVGILTEKDLVDKVIAEDRKSSRVRVGEVMSTPLVTASPRDSVAATAERMAKLGIRRLPVIGDSGELLGILTENDILRISPSLIEITREWARINSPGPRLERTNTSTGYCEVCGSYSDRLVPNAGRLLCPDCQDLES